MSITVMLKIMTFFFCPQLVCSRLFEPEIKINLFTTKTILLYHLIEGDRKDKTLNLPLLHQK